MATLEELLALPSEIPAGETCPWPVLYADCGGACDYSAWGEQAAAAQAVFEQMATDLLWNWTNRIFGACPVVYRPCRSECDGYQAYSTFWGRGPGYDPTFPRWGTSQGFNSAGGGVGGTSGWVPVLIAGDWFNVGCGTCGEARCSCSLEDGTRSLRLPGPVQSVTEVLVDGEVLPPTAYRVDYGRLLIRTDGGTWPACQDLLAEPDQPNTWQVTYVKGVAVPVGGLVAAGRLACELSKSYCGDETCELPENMTQLTRQGLTVTFDSTWETLQAGGTGTGIWSIDGWVASVTRPKPFASVRSVDVKPQPRLNRPRPLHG